MNALEDGGDKAVRASEISARGGFRADHAEDRGNVLKSGVGTRRLKRF